MASHPVSVPSCLEELTRTGRGDAREVFLSAARRGLSPLVGDVEATLDETGEVRITQRGVVITCDQLSQDERVVARFHALQDALNTVALSYFPGTVFPAGTLGALLQSDAAWARGAHATFDGVTVTLEHAHLVSTRMRPTSEWTRYGFTVRVELDGHAPRTMVLEREDHVANIEGWARLPTTDAARAGLELVLADLAREVRAAPDERLDYVINGFTATRALLKSLVRPPAEGSLLPWLQEVLPRLLTGHAHVAGATFCITEVQAPQVALDGFGLASVRLTRAVRADAANADAADADAADADAADADAADADAADADAADADADDADADDADAADADADADAADAANADDPDADANASDFPDEEFVSLGALGPAALELAAPREGDEARDVTALVSRFLEWLDANLDEGGLRFTGYFPLVNLIEQRLLHGPPGAPPVPLPDAETLARAGAKLTPRAQEGAVAAWSIDGWTVLLHDDLARRPFSEPGISLVPPEGGAPCVVMMCDAWNPEARAVIDGDAFAFRRFLGWLRGAVLASGSDPELLFELDEDERDEDEPAEVLLTASDWLLFGMPDHGDRFLVDWRSQWHVVRATAGVEAFAGIYGFTGEKLEQLRDRDVPAWRRFLREVVDPRFGAGR